MISGIVLHCPNPECKKLLMKNAYLPPTTAFKVKCFWCGHMIEVNADYKKLTVRDANQSDGPTISFV